MVNSLMSDERVMVFINLKVKRPGVENDASDSGSDAS